MMFESVKSLDVSQIVLYTLDMLNSLSLEMMMWSFCSCSVSNFRGKGAPSFVALRHQKKSGHCIDLLRRVQPPNSWICSIGPMDVPKCRSNP